MEYKVIVYDSATAACKWANLTENNNNSYIVNWQHSMNLNKVFPKQFSLYSCSDSAIKMLRVVFTRVDY